MAQVPPPVNAPSQGKITVKVSGRVKVTSTDPKVKIERTD